MFILKDINCENTPITIVIYTSYSFHSRLALKYIAGPPYLWGSGPMDLTIQTENAWKQLL